MTRFIGIFLFCIHQLVSCQENAGTNVAPALQICYNTTLYVTRDYRLPSTINVLIALLRKIEDGNTSEDARELSFQILHRFHQDGIKKTAKDIDPNLGLPYSPKGVEAYKNRVLLKKTIPGNALNFNNDSLSTLQECSLHFMISSSIDRLQRGDEGQTCRTSGQYTSRQKRQAETFTEVEKSTCPLESGVVYTRWGDVKAGLLLTGLASGLNPNPTTIKNYRVESTYASTLAGELSEAILNEGVAEKIVGNKGGWNSSIEQKYYFLQSSDKDRMYFTDAEIRGAIDGLLLALNIQDWTSKMSNLKLSQILDLYYNRGVFNRTASACNRKEFFKNTVNNTIVTSQTIGFTYLLEPDSQLPYTFYPANLPDQAANIVKTFQDYLTNSLKDLDCAASDDIFESISTDVLIFIDTNWNHNTIHPLISWILENLNINKYESSYTIFDGSSGDIIVNKSRSILDFYEYFNLTEQQKHPTGFDYLRVLDLSENLFKQKLDNKTDLTGQSQMILMFPHNTPTASQNEYIENKRNYFRDVLPDVRIIVGGSGTKSSYNQLVINPTSDIIQIEDSTNGNSDQLKLSGNSILDRFRKIPRSVTNGECGSSFSSSSSQTFDSINYVEPRTINYHKISPNYFYEGQTLKIKGDGYGTLTVCTSRSEANPRSNSSEVHCNDINSEEVSLDINGYCSDEAPINCSPIYISVQGGSSVNRCRDASCRFPDNIKYTITLENVQCSSGNEIIVPTLGLSVLLFVLMQF